MKLIPFVYFIVAIIILSSCTTNRYIYAPSAPNIPYFNQKGDSKAAAFYSGSGTESFNRRSDGFDLQGAYALSDHWALTTSWFYRKETDRDTRISIFDSSMINYKRKIIETGGGYFISINPKKTITLNVYGGVGVGKFLMSESGKKSGLSYDRFYNVNVLKWYVQPSLNFMPGKYFRFAFYFKPTFVRYGRYTSDYLPDEYTYFGFQKIHKRMISFSEMGYDLQLGIPKVPWIFIEHSVAFAAIKTYNIANTQLVSRGSNVSIGLNVNFGKMKKK